MALKILVTGAALAMVLAAGAANAQQGNTSGPATGGNVQPSAAVQKSDGGTTATTGSTGQTGASTAAGAPGAEAKPGTEGGPAAKPASK